MSDFLSSLTWIAPTQNRPAAKAIAAAWHHWLTRVSKEVGADTKHLRLQSFEMFEMQKMLYLTNCNDCTKSLEITI